eukprot:CAMPEP_0196587862 /NCGR_PEP_ID=MMETSP1081-20130531/58837_1 /TAXON_ID=36882 /ORGANISM="Pyramimonas amylifera, Strain CCMP720" /LENGTH=571 /DNA_ID=CAMNT_0041910179 /DNA_START=158 /DNA_END=1873 /DNA_ORIENTATION=-
MEEGAAKVEDIGTPIKGGEAFFLGRDVISELKARAPFYLSDWSDGNHRKVFAAITYMFFCSIAPAITFAAWLDHKTEREFGVVEVLLSSTLAGGIFAVLGGQPLIIVGVTGPVSIFSITVYEIADTLDLEFLPWMAWISFWSMLMHTTLALTNSCSLISLVTRFSCETFGFLIAIIYIVNAIVDVTTFFKDDTIDAALLQLAITFGSFWLCMKLSSFRNTSIFNTLARDIITDYAVPIAMFIFAAVPFLPKFEDIPIQMLDVPDSFQTTSGRPWLVDWGATPGWACFAAILPGFVLTVLFFFDHNVSSLLSQQNNYNLKKPSAFNYDFMVVGFTILVCGILGIPPTNGLIPQAPLHVRSLAEIEIVEEDGVKTEVWRKVHEQRVSGLGQSLAIGVMLFPLLLKNIIGNIPLAVLDGLFLFLGFASFPGNQFYDRLLLNIQGEDRETQNVYLTVNPPVPRNRIRAFTGVQFSLWSIIFGVTQFPPTAITFPIFIAVLVPLRLYVFPKYFTEEELAALDSEAEVHPSNEEGDEEIPEGSGLDKQKYGLADSKSCAEIQLIAKQNGKHINFDEL